MQKYATEKFYTTVCKCLMEVFCGLDPGPLGESCGFGADAEACESSDRPPGTAATEDHRPAERHANW